MGDRNFAEEHLVVKGTTKASDFLAGTVYSDIYNMQDWRDVFFVVSISSGATGTHRFAVHSNDDVTPTSTHGMVFKYRTTAGTATNSVPAAWAAATSSGFLDTLGVNRQIEIWAKADDLYAGDKFLRLCSSEITDSPVGGAITVIFANPRYGEDINRSVLS